MHATLRAYHDSDPPQRVTLAFAIEPTKQQMVGSPSSMAGVPLNLSGWFLDTEPSTGEEGEDAHLQQLCDRLGSRKAELTSLRESGWTFDVVLHWEHRGFDGPVLSAEVMRALADFGLSLWVLITDEEASRR